MKKKKVYQLRISLRDTKPPIWRRVMVLPDITLGQLHGVIQIAMGWTDSHLHRFILKDKSLKLNAEQKMRLWQRGEYNPFMIRNERHFVPLTTPFGDDLDMQGEDENSVTLTEACPKIKMKLIYIYDFGDSWEHTIEVQKIEEAKEGVDYPICLAGKNACPLEDSGGVWGYYQMLEAIAHPKSCDPEILEWFDDDFDPDAFDKKEVNDMLTEWWQAQSKRKPMLRLRRDSD